MYIKHYIFRNITNIDISEIVIKQMSQYQRIRPSLKYLVGNVTKMEFDKDSFSVVLDKGTLDALMTDESNETINVVKKYFSEVKRVLRKGGILKLT
jgi:ubiquinone/menaquinone biosynthesis C-methylase UbiE